MTTDMAASVRARLLAHAKRHGDTFERILTRYAIERLLFRLSHTDAAQRYVLKGAMLFVTWPDQAFRPTGDLDLLGQGDPDPAAILKVLKAICETDVPQDGIVFDPGSIRIETRREGERYAGVEARLLGTLDGARIPVQIDIGFGDHIHPEPRRQIFPSLLADMPTATLLMYPPETVIAEKFEAIVHLGEGNTRLKDYYDIWLTTRTFGFNLADVVGAVSGTLKRRETPIPENLPVGLRAHYARVAVERGLWSGFLRRTPPTRDPPAFPKVQADLVTFFTPVLDGLLRPDSAQGRWDPHAGTWTTGP